MHTQLELLLSNTGSNMSATQKPSALVTGFVGLTVARIEVSRTHFPETELLAVLVRLLFENFSPKVTSPAIPLLRLSLTLENMA